MSEEKQGRPAWKSPFKMGLLILTAALFVGEHLWGRCASGACWEMCGSLLVFAGSFLVAALEPDRFLETAAMPFFAVLVLGIIGWVGQFFLVALIAVLVLSVPGAFLGAVAGRFGRAVRNKVGKRDAG